MGPLSGKEQRENLKFALDQKRKDELHALKLQEQKVSVEKAKGKANQELKQKDESHRVKLGAAPLSSIKPMEVTVEAGNEVAQTMAPLQMGAGQDTVPAMLTPGEAVIPKTVAQDPQYKPVIEQMVSEGRDRNQQMKGYNYGTPNVRGYNDGTAGVPPVDMSIPYPEMTLRPQYAAPPVAPVMQSLPPSSDAYNDWRTATMGQETNYGNNPNTWKENNQGALGFFQLTRNTFDGLKRNKMIPQDYEFTNPVHNTEASEVLMQDTWKRAGGDAAKAAAIHYGGPKAVDKDGNIVSYKDLKNPNAPDTVRYSQEVMARMLNTVPKPNDSTDGQLRYDNNGRLIPADPNAPKSAVPKPDIQAMYDTRIASPDSLTSVNPDSPNKAMRAQGNTATVDPSTGQIVNAVTDMPPPAPRSATPAPTKTDEDLLPEVESSVVSVAEKHGDKFQQVIDNSGGDQAKLESGMISLFDEIYSTDGKNSMFSRKDLIRMAILTAGGIMTGGSTKGSLRYAGLDVLKNADARAAAQGSREYELEKARIAAAGKKEKPDQVKSIRWRGKTFSAIQGADGRYYTVDPSGKQSFYDGAQDSAQWATANREVTSSVENMITPFVGSKDMAGAVSVQTASVVEDMEAAGANIEPQNVAQMARKAVRVAGQPPDENASPEERQAYMDRVTNAFYTEAAVAIRPSHSKLFYHEGKPLTDDAGNARMRTAIQQAPGESMDKKIDNLVDEYKEARNDPNRKAVMERIARANPGSPPMDVYLIAKSRNFQ